MKVRRERTLSKEVT